jgi:hypothetical protein
MSIEDRIRTFLTPKFPEKRFLLEFSYNGRDYKTHFTASHNENNLEVANPCVNMTYEYIVDGKPKQAFIGEIKANSEESSCFEPMLVTNNRNKPGKRTTAADVLQILKTKLALLFPTSTPITIYDGARNDMTMISPFHIMRGGDAFYEKYGYVSPAIAELKELVKEFTWGECNEEQTSMIKDCTKLDDYPSEMKLIDIMKTITWEKETKYNTANERSLSYRIFRWFAVIRKHYSFEQTNQFAVGTIWDFTLNKDDPRWKRSETDLVFTKFREITAGGKSRRYTRRRRR